MQKKGGKNGTKREGRYLTKNGCCGYDHVAHKTPEISARFDNTQYFLFFLYYFFFQKKVINNINLIIT